MSDNGWVKIHRDILKWEWYSDIPTKTLFIHLLLKANHHEGNWRGKVIKRGQHVTSLGHLASETGLSIQSVRTSLSKLKSTSEITSQSTSQYTLITIVNYDTYQENGNASNKPSNQQGNKPATNDQQTINNKQEEKELKKKKNKNTNPLADARDEVCNDATVTSVTPTPLHDVETEVHELSEDLPLFTTKGEALTAKIAPGKPELFTGEWSLAPHLDTPEAREAVTSWIEHKGERRQGYKPMGLRKLFKKLNNYQHPTTLVSSIEHSISNNYQGVFQDPKASPPPVDPSTLPPLVTLKGYEAKLVRLSPEDRAEVKKTYMAEFGDEDYMEVITYAVKKLDARLQNDHRRDDPTYKHAPLLCDLILSMMRTEYPKIINSRREMAKI